MRHSFFSLLLLFIFLSHVAQGASVSPFSSTDQKRKVFSLTEEEYEDTRIDYDQDKEIDYWKIKNNNLIVEIYFTPIRTIYHIRNFKKSTVDERILFSEKGELYLHLSRYRKQAVLNFTKDGPLCSTNQSQEWEKIKNSFSTFTENNAAVNADIFVGGQCAEILEPEVYGKLNSVTREIYSPGKSSDSLLTCLEGPKVRDIFIKRFGEKEGALNHEKAVIGFKNSLIKFTQLAKKPDEAILTCKKVDGKTPANPMKVLESGKQIQFQFGDHVNLNELKEQLVHESLHISSISDEKTTTAVTDFCLKNITPNIVPKITNAAINKALSSPTTALDVLKGEQEVAKSESQKIPKNIAETPVTPTKDKSPVDMNRMADAAGTATVAEVSKAQTSGVVRMAESVLGSTPAVAAEPSTSLASSSSATTGSGSSSSGSSSGSSAYTSSSSYVASNSSTDDSRPARRTNDSSRSPASDYQLDMSTVGAKAPTVKIPTSAANSGVGKGEYIKEEVDLTRPIVTANSNSVRSPASTQTSSSDVSASSPALKANNIDQPSSGGGSYGASGGGASSVSLGSSSQSSNSSTSGSTQRRGTSSQTTGGSYVPSRDEVVSFFSGGSYQQARGKLKDQTFVQTLKQNNITVYDLGGNTYGAPKGEIIFVDQGDRFVRQK